VIAAGFFLAANQWPSLQHHAARPSQWQYNAVKTETSQLIINGLVALANGIPANTVSCLLTNKTKVS